MPPAGCALQMRQLHLTPTAINKQTAKLCCRQRFVERADATLKQTNTSNFILLLVCAFEVLQHARKLLLFCYFTLVFLFILLDNRSSVRAPKCQQCRYCPILWHLHTFVACNYTIIYVMKQLAKLFTQMK